MLIFVKIRDIIIGFGEEIINSLEAVGKMTHPNILVSPHHFFVNLTIRYKL